LCLSGLIVGEGGGSAVQQRVSRGLGITSTATIRQSCSIESLVLYEINQPWFITIVNSRSKLAARFSVRIKLYELLGIASPDSVWFALMHFLCLISGIFAASLD